MQKVKFKGPLWVLNTSSERKWIQCQIYLRRCHVERRFHHAGVICRPLKNKKPQTKNKKRTKKQWKSSDWPLCLPVCSRCGAAGWYVHANDNITPTLCLPTRVTAQKISYPTKKQTNKQNHKIHVSLHLVIWRMVPDLLTDLFDDWHILV